MCALRLRHSIFLIGCNYVQLRQLAVQTMRLFVALQIPGQVQEALVTLRQDMPGLRWANNVHLTLRFIGQVTDAQAQEVEQALKRVVFAPFVLRLNALGMFARHSSIVWAGLEDSFQLHDLKKQVDSALLDAIGLAPENRYSPHITLARMKSKPNAQLKAFVEQHARLPELSFRVERFVLFSSQLKPDGAVHMPAAVYSCRKN